MAMDMDMDIMEIVDMLEETIDKASAVPLTGKVMVDKDELLDYIQEIRLVYPDELKEAKWVKEERQRILSEAESRAEAIQKNAEETQMQLIDEHEVTKRAYEQANELVNAAQTKSIEIKTDTDQYVDDILNDAEHRLDLLLRKIREDRSYFNNN
ncbi:MAG: ATPase [Clostridia bacterium]|nr:ATPase [Clostridia bacterium]MBQ3462301.1 ATPase [Clostridia bacterium]MBQ6530765.1 ATPase [Clostridia bacterium]MBQ6558023.1 ATPase [Clostridia bacterium]MBQ9599752.1 ATPase [Clostridia bacterium]